MSAQQLVNFKPQSATHLVLALPALDQSLSSTFENILSGAEFEDFARKNVYCVNSLKDYLEQNALDILLIDREVLGAQPEQELRSLSKIYEELAIVVLANDESALAGIDALNLGAQDIVYKNDISSAILMRTLRMSLQRKRIESSLKKALQVKAQQNWKLKQQANRDGLTGLPNRSYFEMAAQKLLNRAKRSGEHVALLYMDINDFKLINDNMGHVVGDAILKEFANRLEQTVRASDFVARLGGDEFVVLTDSYTQRHSVYGLVERLLQAFVEPVLVREHLLVMEAAIGVAFFPEAPSLDILVRQADHAMYEAKAKSEPGACFFTDSLEALYSRNILIRSLVESGVKDKEFFVHFQPIVSVDKEEQVMVEALLRWNSKELGAISPVEFIPLIENSPIMNDITKEVLRSCAQFRANMLNLHMPEPFFKVNVSASQLSHTSFFELVRSWVEELDLLPECLCLELTEREMVSNAERCKEQIVSLRNYGVHMALDDFGTGYSSFTHLMEFPVDYLKIDRVLISKIHENKRNQALVAGIVEMASRLGMKIVAEGIEDHLEYRFAEQLGCDYFQGFHFSKPVPMQELTWLYLSSC